MNLTIFLVLQLLLNNNLNHPDMYPKHIIKNGMTVSWTVQTDHVQFTLQSPKQGWVAIGINTDVNLVSSNLIMASVENDIPKISDRFVIDLGNHKAVTELRATSATKLIEAYQNIDGTTVTFIINKKSNDKYHYDLIEGQTYYLTMAYSLEDDFQHHSIMRTTLKFIL